MIYIYSEVSNWSLNTVSELEALAVAIMLYLYHDAYHLELEFMIGEILILADDKAFDKHRMIKFDREQWIDYFTFTLIVQSLLKFNRKRIGDGKCITIIKYPVKPSSAYYTRMIKQLARKGWN